MLKRGRCSERERERVVRAFDGNWAIVGGGKRWSIHGTGLNFGIFK